MLKRVLLLISLLLSTNVMAQCIEPAPVYRVMVYEMVGYFCNEFYPYTEPQRCMDSLTRCVDQIMSQRILSNESEKERAFNAVMYCATYDL